MLNVKKKSKRDVLSTLRAIMKYCILSCRCLKEARKQVRIHYEAARDQNMNHWVLKKPSCLENGIDENEWNLFKLLSV